MTVRNLSVVEDQNLCVSNIECVMNDTFLDIKWSYINIHSNTADFVLHVRRKGKEDMKITHQPVRMQYRNVTIRHQFTDKQLRIKVIRRTAVANGYARYTSKY